jgi:hypothetical protein
LDTYCVDCAVEGASSVDQAADDGEGGGKIEVELDDDLVFIGDRRSLP